MAKPSAAISVVAIPYFLYAAFIAAGSGCLRLSWAYNTIVSPIVACDPADRVSTHAKLRTSHYGTVQPAGYDRGHIYRAQCTVHIASAAINASVSIN